MKKLIWIVAPLAVSVFLIGAFLFLRQDRSNVRIDQSVPGLGTSFWMNVEVLEPFAVFKDGFLVSSESAPEWALSAIWTLELTEDLVRERISPEYIAAYGMPELHRPSPNFTRTVFYGVHVKIDSGEYMIRCNAAGDQVFKEIPEGSDIGAGILKRIDGHWMLYPDFDGRAAIPWNHLERLREIIRTGRATVDDFGNLAPFPEPE